MSKRILVGYFIQRTWKRPPHDGETLFAESHRLYKERGDAEIALARDRVGGGLDDRFNYDVAEAWMHTEEQ